MPTTSNFGWTTPADTDLVKDGAAAIRTLGNGIDTSLIDLKGGTTGQILSKASNTDLDYTWINNDQGDITAVTAGTGISGGGTTGAVTITNDMATTITAAGDIVVGTGSGTYDNLPIGTTGQVLTADTTVSPYKVKWATVAAASFVGVSAKRTTNLNLTTSTWTNITFPAEDFDTDAFHDNSTDSERITIPVGKGGKYLISCNIQFQSFSTGVRLLKFQKNGADLSMLQWVNANASQDTVFSGSHIADLAAGDYVTVQAWHNAGSNLGVGDSATCFFQAQYLGA